MTDVGSGIAIRRLEKENAALRAEVERLRAYLPLARALVRWSREGEGLMKAGVFDALDALTPEQRAWLMEDK